MTTVSTPKISVVIPVHNGAAYLREALESIITQTFQDFELLIMDDGSTDSTSKIIKDFAEKDHRIKIFHQQNSGVVKSLNTLIAHSKTSFIARMDADDIAYPKRLKAQYEYMKNHPKTVLLGTYAKIIESKKNWRRNTAFTEDILNRWYLSIIPPFIHSGVMFSKHAFDQAGGYREDEYPAEDYGLWVRMKHFGHLNSIPETLMDYHLNDRGISSKNFKKQIAKRDELNFKNLEDLYEKNEIPTASEALKLLTPYNLNRHQRQVLGKLACCTGCFYIKKNNYSKAKEYFRLCLKMDPRRFDAALNLILGKFGKAFLISIDKYPAQLKFLFKTFWFTRTTR